jgi:hypothetical protein
LIHLPLHLALPESPTLSTYPAPQSTIALDVNLKGVINTVNVIRHAWREDDTLNGTVGKGRKVVLIASMGAFASQVPLAPHVDWALTEREAIALRRMVRKQAVWMVYHSPRCIRRLNTA